MTNTATFDFSGARVLVTGGTSGIGHAVARAFVDAGAVVTVTGTGPDAAAYATDLDGCTYRQLRLDDPGSVDALVADLAAELDALDVLVNNAGATFAGGLDEWTPDGFAAALGLNLAGPMRLTAGCRPLLAASTAVGGASVIGLASMAAYRASRIVPGYGAAKAGLVALTGSLALQWAADGIRVNAVAPGIIDTPMTAPMAHLPELLDAELAHTPMGRLGTPDEVAGVVLFLASASASFLTGHTVAVDGGYLLP
ncbi:MAG: SDR family oxidoreductase [Acidimicrobiales bacterium]